MQISDTLSTLLTDYQSSAAASKTQDTTATNPADLLSQVNSINDQPVDFGASYVLDLSTAAQSALDSSSSGGTSGIYGGIQLTQSQITKLNDILSNYKDATINSDTLSSLYADLQASGLLPSQLVSVKQAESFNPTQVFLDILNGSSNAASSSGGSLGGLLGGSSTNNTSQSLVDKLGAYSALSGNVNPNPTTVDPQLQSYLNLFDQGGIIA